MNAQQIFNLWTTLQPQHLHLLKILTYLVKYVEIPLVSILKGNPSLFQ